MCIFWCTCRNGDCCCYPWYHPRVATKYFKWLKARFCPIVQFLFNTVSRMSCLKWLKSDQMPHLQIFWKFIIPLRRGTSYPRGLGLTAVRSTLPESSSACLYSSVQSFWSTWHTLLPYTFFRVVAFSTGFILAHRFSEIQDAPSNPLMHKWALHHALLFSSGLFSALTPQASTFPSSIPAFTLQFPNLSLY